MHGANREGSAGAATLRQCFIQPCHTFTQARDIAQVLGVKERRRGAD